jgi:hypothetical protein
MLTNNSGTNKKAVEEIYLCYIYSKPTKNTYNCCQAHGLQKI